MPSRSRTAAGTSGSSSTVSTSSTLGYRLIGRDTVLWDEDAGLVVDVITEALPAPRIWPFLDIGSHDLRQTVRRALADAGLDPAALLDEMSREQLPGAARPIVGLPFSWRVGTAMPPSLLHALPPLTPPLEYRLAGAALVVIDLESGVVAGVLPDALPSRPGHVTTPA